jgi:hypothetical protein
LISTDERNFFEEKYFDTTTKSNTQQGGTTSCNATNSNTYDRKYSLFPYFLPKLRSEKTFENWFAQTIYKTTSFHNKYQAGNFNVIPKNKNDFMIFIFGGTALTIGGCFFSIITAFLSVYYLFTSMNPFLSTKLWFNILIGIISWFTLCPALFGACLVYYPLKYILKTLYPLFFDTIGLIDIVKCNISSLAYVLTLIMVVSGWKHLSVIVAALMTLMWFGMGISDLYAKFKI